MLLTADGTSRDAGKQCQSLAAQLGEQREDEEKNESSHVTSDSQDGEGLTHFEEGCDRIRRNLGVWRLERVGHSAKKIN